MVVDDRWRAGKADVWWLAHRRELIQQPLNLLHSFGLPATSVLAGEHPDPKSSIHVASIATLVNRRIAPRRPIAVVIVDEAHRVVSQQHMMLLEHFKEAYGRENIYILLLSATPYRLDGKPLGDVADALVEMTTPLELIERGIIMEPTVIGEEAPDMTGVVHRGGDWVREAVAERVDRPKLVGHVVDTWLQYANGAPSVYFACGIAHSRHLVERFQSVGVRAAHLDGTTPTEERSRILARLAIGGRGSDHPEALDVCSNVDVLREGWDSESDYSRVLMDRTLWLGRSHPPDYHPLEVLGDCDPTESCCAYRQREGRVCRAHANKRQALLISHSGNWKRHGFLRDHHGFSLDKPNTGEGSEMARRTRVAVFQARHCLACLSVWPATTEVCSCGQALAKPPALPDENEAVELGVVRQTTYIAPPDPGEERLYLRSAWAKLKRDNFARKANGQPPIKDGRVMVLFKKRYNRWPSQQMLLATKREVGA